MRSESPKNLDSSHAETIRAYYDAHYADRAETSHSEPATRAKINRAILSALGRGILGENPVIADIGAGSQGMIDELILIGSRVAKLRDMVREKTTFLTVDFAAIPEEHLKAQSYPNVHHIRASGSELPLKPESVDMIVSNLAIDLMPPNTIHEAAGALKKGGYFAFMLHHPLFLHLLASNPKHGEKLSEIADETLLGDSSFMSREAINRRFKDAGFSSVRIEVIDQTIRVNGENRREPFYWFVTGRK